MYDTSVARCINVLNVIPNRKMQIDVLVTQPKSEPKSWDEKAKNEDNIGAATTCFVLYVKKF